jgi:hypothetical protein
VVLIGSLLLILLAVALLGLGLVQGSNAYLVGSIAASLLAAVVLVGWVRRAVAARTTPLADAADGLGAAEPPSMAEQSPATGAEAGRRATNGTVSEAEADGTLSEAEAEGTASEVEPVAETTDAGSEGAAVPAEEPERVAATSRHNGTGPGHVELDLNLDGHLDGADLDDADLASADLASGDLDEEDPADEPAPQIVPPADAARIAVMSAPVYVVDGRPRYHLRGCVHLLGRESEALPVSEAVELGFTPCSLCEPDTVLLADARRV